MSTLSLHENSEQAIRADRLCRIIESCADDLRNVEIGRRFSRDGVLFRLFRADRNTIYQLDDGVHWFLKMPRSGNVAVIEREIVGAEAVRNAVGDFSGYRHPDVVRASVSDAYLLATKLPGRMLNWGLIPTVLPVRWFDGATRKALSCLGSVLAKFHQSPVRSTLPTTTRPVARVLHKAVERATRRDKTYDLIERHLDQFTLRANSDCMVHGNFHVHNVLYSDQKVSLIDFENCGRGSACDDLSLMCAQLVCTGLSLQVSEEGVAGLRNAFLESYSQQRSIDLDLLGQAIIARVCDYYISGFCRDRARPTVLGLPVLRSRVQRLVQTLLSNGPAAALLANAGRRSTTLSRQSRQGTLN